MLHYEGFLCPFASVKGRMHGFFDAELGELPVVALSLLKGPQECDGSNGSLNSRDYSTSFPAVSTSPISSLISAGTGGIDSRTTPPCGDQTRFTCSCGSCSG